MKTKTKTAKAGKPARKPRRANPVYAVDKAWFFDRFRDVGRSLRSVARAVGVDPATLSRTLDGKHKLGVIEAGELASVLLVSPAEVLARAGSPLSTVEDSASVSVVGLVGADFKTLRTRPAVIPPATAPIGGDELQGLRFQCEGTAVEHWDQAVVFFRPSRAVQKRAVGRLSVVRVEGEAERRVCVLRAGKRGKFDLCSVDGSVAEAGVALESASPVEWVRF